MKDSILYNCSATVEMGETTFAPAGNGTEGDLFHITYELSEGAALPEVINFYFGLANLPGTSMDPELLNIVCGYPDENNPVAISFCGSELNLKSPEFSGLSK